MTFYGFSEVSSTLLYSSFGSFIEIQRSGYSGIPFNDSVASSFDSNLIIADFVCSYTYMTAIFPNLLNNFDTSSFEFKFSLRLLRWTVYNFGLGTTY